jgi:hypothetical protein
MTKPLRFDDEAVEELDAAAVWYEARRVDLGIEFIALVREALDRIAENPQAWPLVQHVPRARPGARVFGRPANDPSHRSTAPISPARRLSVMAQIPMSSYQRDRTPRSQEAEQHECRHVDRHVA